MKDQAGGGGVSRLAAVIAAVVAFGLAGAAFAIGAPGGNGGNPGGQNNGGGSPSGGNSSCVTDQNCSHNPPENTKPCTPVPGNGCHQLPDTPCDRGHGGVQDKNKHCAPATPVTPVTPTKPTTPASPTTPATGPPATSVSGVSTTSPGISTSGVNTSGTTTTAVVKVTKVVNGQPVVSSVRVAVPPGESVAAAAQAVTRTARFTG